MEFCRSRLGISTKYQVLLTLSVSVLYPMTGLAAVSAPTGPATNTSGSYTIYYPVNEETTECDLVTLEERVIGVTGWKYVSDPGHDGIVFFTDKATGDYQYRSRAYCEDYYGEASWSEFSSAITVKVSRQSVPPPVPGTPEEQLFYNYIVRSGNINGDAYTDLYIKRVSGGEPLDGSIDNIILAGLAGGQFSVLVPSSGQIAIASNWPVRQIDIALDDFNADGFLDLLLRSVSTFVSGAFDQIVFSPAQVLSATPKGVRSVTPGFLGFIDDLHQFNHNDNYFIENSVEVEGGYWDSEFDCELIWWGDYPEWICTYYPVWVEYSYITYPGIHSRAVKIWEAWQDFQDGSGSYGAMVSLFETELGATVGSQDVCETRDETGVQISKSDQCDGISVSAAIAIIRRQTRELHEMEEPIFFGRKPDQVYVTAHKVAWAGPFHLAIEYRDPVDWVPNWLSSGPVPGPTITGRKLVANENRDTDWPHLNDTVAVVSSTRIPSAAAYFSCLQGAQSQYDDDLPYAFFPENSLVVDYNSNGYVAGLINATNGSADFSVSDFSGFAYFYGGRTPVPADEFKPLPSICN